MKAVVAYNKKLSTSVQKPIKLNQEMEKKRKIIVRSFSLARNIYEGSSQMHPSKESDLDAGAEFLEVYIKNLFYKISVITIIDTSPSLLQFVSRL